MNTQRIALQPLRVSLAAMLTLVGAGCGRDGGDEAGGEGITAAETSDLSGRIQEDGSSTVGPFTTAAA